MICVDEGISIRCVMCNQTKMTMSLVVGTLVNPAPYQHQRTLSHRMDFNHLEASSYCPLLEDFE
jgi:hypothetical protein